MNTFDGETYDEDRDGDRLRSLYDRVRSVMWDGLWHTLAEVAHKTGGTEASVSARLRDFRKAKFGGHIVERRYVEHGLWEYRLIPNDGDNPPPAPGRRRWTRDDVDAAVSEWWDHARYEGRERLVEILCDELADLAYTMERLADWQPSPAMGATPLEAAEMRVRAMIMALAGDDQ